MYQAAPDIRVHLEFGESLKEPTLIAANLHIITDAEEVVKTKQELLSKGVSDFDYSNRNHYFLELNCDPGCEMEIYDEINLAKGEQEEDAQPYIFHNFIKMFSERFKFCVPHLATGKVYLQCANNELLDKSGGEEESAEAAAPDSKSQHVKSTLGKLSHDIKLTLNAEGDFRRTNEHGHPRSLGISYLDMNVEYPSTAELGQLIVGLLKDIKKQHPLFTVLPSLKRANVDLRLQSLEWMSEELTIEMKQDEYLPPFFRDNKNIVHNTLSLIVFEKWGKCVIKLTVKLEKMSLLIAYYMARVFDYVK